MIDKLLYAALVVLAAFTSNVLAASWTVNVGEEAGLPVLTKGGAAAFSTSYAFWANNWKWAGQQTTFKVTAPFDYSVLGKNQTLNFDLASRIKKTASKQLAWTFDLDVHSAMPDAIGGGMVFKFDLDKFGRELGEPERLPKNQGWAWGRPGGSRVEMRFEPPLAVVFFERGRKDEIRAYFYKDGIPAGRRHYMATLTVSRDMAIGPTTSERFDPIDLAAWTPDILDWKTSPVDLSFLNAPEKPAGKRGFLKAIKGKLVFEDGTTARFWGTNLTAYTLFGTSKENAKQQARRLSELGFNLVRIHHHDSPWVNPNIFGAQNVPNTQHLDSAMLDKLDWWIKCLKDEGIYVWLDLHVERAIKKADRIEGFDEISKGQSAAIIKGYNYVNPSIQQAMQRFNEAYVNHSNPYTGTRYKDEPAIAAMLITNENDITHHFGNSLLPDKKVPKHNAIYMRQAEAFAATNGLSKDKTWRSWEHGPSKLFLNDLEQRFNAEMIAHLRAQGVKIPIATTNTWGANPISSLPALTTGNIIDAHSYGGIGELEKNPLYTSNLTHWIAAAQLADRPLSVTEWNVSPFPAPDRHTIPLYVAASASLQGWDALMQYAYSQVPLNTQDTPSNWHAYHDPSLISTLPAAALLYRQGHVQEALNTYVFAPSKEQLFYQNLSPASSVALRTAPEISRLVIALPQTKELPWLEKTAIPDGAKRITDSNQSLISGEASEAISDTGELRRNWEQGVYTISTPRTQAAMGWLGGRIISLPNFDLTATTRNATVVVQSLDEKPIATSSRLMISLGARSVLARSNQLPFYSEPVEGELSIAAAKGLKAYKKLAANGELHQIAAPYRDGRYVIKLDRTLQTYWLFLR